MNVAGFVNAYQESDEPRISFAWNGKHAEHFEDANQDFRRAVCEHFRRHKAEFPLSLIAALYAAETKWAREAWCVNPIVSELAQEMLERGGTDYLDTYAAGVACGMDAFIQSGQISLSEKRRVELLTFCSAQRAVHRGSQREKVFELLQQRFEGLNPAV